MSEPLTSTDTALPLQPDQNKEIVVAAKGGSALFLGRLYEYASRFIFGIIVARAIGVEGYGLYNLGIVTALALSGIALLGMPSAVVKFMPPAIKDHDDARTWSVLQISIGAVAFLSIIISLIVFALSEFLAVNIFDNPEAVYILRWISLAIPLMSVGRVLMASTRAFKRMEFQVYADSLAFNTSKIILSVIFLALGFGIPGVMAAHALAWVLEVGLLIYFLNKVFPLKRSLRLKLDNFKEIITFAAPLWLNQFITQLEGKAELFLLGIIGTVAAVGIYSATLRIQMIGIMFLVAAEMVAMPIISDLFHQGSNNQLKQLYQTLTRWSFSFVLPFFVTTLLFAAPLLGIFGKEFETGATALVIITLGTLVNAGTGICGAMIVMTGYSKLTFINSALGLILAIILDVLLIPAWGVEGAAIAAALSVTLVNLARLIQVQWLLKLWPYNLSFIKPTIAGIGAFALTAILNYFLPGEANIFYLLFNIAVLWLSYIGIIILAGLTPDDRLILGKVKRRFNILARV